MPSGACPVHLRCTSGVFLVKPPHMIVSSFEPAELPVSVLFLVVLVALSFIAASSDCFDPAHIIDDSLPAWSSTTLLQACSAALRR